MRYVPHMASKIRNAQDEADRARAEVLSARIRDALTKTGNDRTKAAELLEMPKRTFYRRLDQVGLLAWKPGQPVPRIPAPKRAKAT